MNAATIPDPTSAFAGGFYAGRIRIGTVLYALIVSPKLPGEYVGVWHTSYASIEGATSYNDGLANTNAMAEAGSALAKWARDLRIGGFDDWYIPSLDELEVCYRHLKPSSDPNSCWARSGINLNSDPAAHPYTPEFPLQTENDLFRVGGSEAFDEGSYWTSTQHESSHSDAWGQSFDGGSQGDWFKGSELRARAVRRLAI